MYVIHTCDAYCQKLDFCRIYGRDTVSGTITFLNYLHYLLFPGNLDVVRPQNTLALQL